MCAGAAAGGASSRASHDAAGHLPAGRGEAAEAGTQEGLVLALPLMRVRHCRQQLNQKVVVTADGVIISQGQPHTLVQQQVSKQ